MPNNKNKNRDDEFKTQTIQGQVYNLRESSAVKSWPLTLAKGTLRILTLPLMIPLTLLGSVVMATPLRTTLFALFLPKVMRKVDEEFQEERRELLRIPEGSSVLDVGSGGGAYFPYLGKARRVVAVEPSTALHSTIQQTARDNGLLSPSKEFLILTDLEQVTGTFDYVILGNVLCEVPDVDDTLDTVDRLLVDKGLVYFSEHVARPKGTWKRIFQDTWNPFHRHISVGCNCNRDSLDKIYKKANWEVVFWKYEHFQVAMGPFVLGLAVKG